VGACAHKVAEAEHQFVLPVLALIVVSVLQDFAIRNLLPVLLVAVLFVINAQAVGSAAATAEISTVVAAYHICTGCATLEMQDHVMSINLLLLLLEFFPLRAAMLHRWLKKIQNILSGRELVYINTCTLYTV
jgi:hypothetical protein